MRMIRLSKVSPVNRYNDSDDATEGSASPTVETMVNMEAIRCFYARKDGRPGTRITFLDGGGFAVTESYAEVASRIAANL